MHIALTRSLAALAALAFAAIVAPSPLYAQEGADTTQEDAEPDQDGANVTHGASLTLEDSTDVWVLPGVQLDEGEIVWPASGAPPWVMHNVALLTLAEADLLFIDVDGGEDDPSGESLDEGFRSSPRATPGEVGEARPGDLKISDMPSRVYSSEPSNTPNTWLRNDTFCPGRMGWPGF